MAINIEGLTPFEQEEALKKLLLRKKILELQTKQKDDFLLFVRTVWPEFIAGNHHKIIAKKLCHQDTQNLNLHLFYFLHG